jgi:hypothetical protein
MGEHMGLYDDDNASVTSGDLGNKDYWYSKAHNEALEQALKSKQPEGFIKDLLPEVIKAHDAVLKTYPNHEDVKKWKAKATTIQGKINPKADWSGAKPGFGWDINNSPLIHGWVEYHWMKWAQAAGEKRTAYEQAQSATNHLGDYGAKKFYKGWPDDLKAWVDKALEEADAVYQKRDY